MMEPTNAEIIFYAVIAVVGNMMKNFKIGE